MSEHKDKEIAQWLSGQNLPLPRDPPPAVDADEAICQPFFQGRNTSDPAATPLQVFEDPKNHVDATSSILTYAANETGFHPAADDIAETATKFDAYIKKVSTFPGFTLVRNDKTTSFQSSLNISVMIEDIKSTYDGVVLVDAAKIVESIQRMAATVLSQSHAEQSKSLFAQAAITKATDSTLVEISIFYTTFHMKKSTSGKKTYTEQSYSINRTVFKVLTSVLTANAPTLAEKILKAPIDDWLSSNSSPTGGKVGKTCFDNLPASREQ